MKTETYFSLDVSEFLFVLAKYKVRYLIVGGEAVIYYGHARLTGDIDLFYEVTRANARILFEAITEFWDGKIPGIEHKEELMKKGMIFQFGVPPNRIDLISHIQEVDFGPAWRGKQTEEISFRRKRFPVFYIGLNDLIKNKEATGRNRDKEDIRFLREAKKRRKK